MASTASSAPSADEAHDASFISQPQEATSVKSQQPSDDTSPRLSPKPETGEMSAVIHETSLATSQDMVKSASSDSLQDSKDGAGGPSSYGTRSRNRTGTSRPNYAEDKDLDTEIFESAADKKDDQVKKSSRLAKNQAAQEASTRNANLAASAKLPPVSDLKNGVSQDRNSTPAANAATTPAPNQTASKSKKRKAPMTNGSSHIDHHASSNGHALGTPSARRKRDNGGYASTNMVSFDQTNNMLKNGEMTADDGTVYKRDDHIYIICEPPGEPYYIARIVDWIHVDGDRSKPVNKVVCNWFYRPRDMGKAVQDTRVLFATMHKDESPLTSIRGKCTIKHKAEFASLDEYRKTPDSFWFDKLYDRYIMKYYDVIPTSQIVNVPERVKLVLNDCWRYVFFEQGRGKELTGAAKSCKRCSNYCASNESVECAVCHNTYHMNCVSPPLLKKPSRGFGWSCAACSRAQERKLQARNVPNALDTLGIDQEDEEMLDEEEDEHAALGTNRTTPDAEPQIIPPTPSQAQKMSLWPWRYLGIHCKPEDALDYDDHIEPRASSRLGTRHQANVLPWYGRPVQFVKPPEVKKTGKKDSKASKEAQAALEASRLERERRPKYIQDEPAGFVVRGEDYDNDDPRNTARSEWKPRSERTNDDAADANNVVIAAKDDETDQYMDKARRLNVQLHLADYSTNLQDMAERVLFKHDYDSTKALEELSHIETAKFREPDLSPAEQKKFEDGVAKYGSDLHAVWKHVKSVSKGVFYGDIVRHYYKWKKTEKGQQIWGNRTGRKSKKEAKEAKRVADEAAHVVVEDIADDQDDSAFDSRKAEDRKKAFICRFCNTKHSRQWRRAPNLPPIAGPESNGKTKEKSSPLVSALCRRCAELWRRYAIQWEDMDEVHKKLAKDGGRGWKRKVDEELLKELHAANEKFNNTKYDSPEPVPLAKSSTAIPSTNNDTEPPKKKLKGAVDKDNADANTEAGTISKKKEKAEKPVEKSTTPPVPEIPKPKIMPCAVCLQLEPLGDQHISCRECRMTVHRNCYGVTDSRVNGKWTCEMCTNDKNPQVSTHYKCVLCPIQYIQHDFVDPPKVSHKKKTEKDKERERLEREAAFNAAEYYQKRQIALGRPLNPFEPLKKTVDNNWVHVTCAVWTPEVKFGNAKALEPCEGISSIPRTRYNEVCKVCKSTGGACVSCHSCHTSVHVECAHQQGYVLGFDVTPVKGSRRDQHNIVTLGSESGHMAALVWCKEHVPKTIVHPINEIVDESGTTALQLYVQHFKQADLTLTGCARKANFIAAAAKWATAQPVSAAPVRRGSIAVTNGASLPNTFYGPEDDIDDSGNVCRTCGVGVSLRWYPIEAPTIRRASDGSPEDVGTETQRFLDQRTVQCHKCWKSKKQPRAMHSTRPDLSVSRDLQQSASEALPEYYRVARRQSSHEERDPYYSSSWSRQPSPPSVRMHSNGMPHVEPYQLAAPAGPPMASGPPPPPMATFAPPRSIIPPRAAPPVAMAYPPPPAPAVPATAWGRPMSSHGEPLAPPTAHMNGGYAPRPSGLAAPNHHRPHPPPAPHNSGLAHSSQRSRASSHASMTNGHMPPSYSNGYPPSPRHTSGHLSQPLKHQSPLTNGDIPPSSSVYPSHSHNGVLGAYPVGYMNGGPPPPPPPPPSRGPEPPYAPPFHGRSPFATPHGSPPVPRETLMRGREENMPPAAPTAIMRRPSETRPANAASASPSLHNLLH